MHWIFKNWITKFLLALAIVVTIPAIHGQDIHPMQSALASNKFYKIELSKNGVYKINKAFIDKLGITQAIDLKKIKVFTNYGGYLPETISETKKSDLLEVPLSITDVNNNNIFDAGDEVFFYGETASKWNFNETLNKWVYTNNIYDINNYAFVTVEGADGKRISESEYETNPLFTTSQYDQLQIYDEDKINLLTREVNTQGSGKKWFGDYFRSGDVKNYNSKFSSNLFAKTENIIVQVLFAGRSPQKGNIELTVGANKSSSTLNSVNINSAEVNYASLAVIEQQIAQINSNDPISITYNGNAQNAEAWLDFIQLTGKSTLEYLDGQFLFADKNSIGKSAKYKWTGNTQGLKIWDVTAIDSIKQVSLSNDNSFSIKQSQILRKFVSFLAKDAFEPIAVGAIKNQNIHSLSQVDMLVIYPEILKEEALKLAKHRGDFEKLNIATISVEEVFNEFSSGRKDVSAIRNFAKMIYDRDTEFKYLLLFGDATYDSRFIMNKENGISYLPVFETEESLNPIFAFPSDDYYGLLSNNEGGNLIGALDIAVGRIPVKNKDEAMKVVNKIINYDLESTRFGDWRMSMGFVADDSDNNTHIVQADRISKKVSQLNPEMNVRKIYFDAYQQLSTPGGQRFPEATADIANQVFKGLLAMCYLGHGGPSGLAQERVLQINDIKNWDNKKKPLVFITATCSLTGYDNPSFVTTGEEAILMPDGGAIVLFSTVRSVYSSENERLTSSVFDFIYTKENGLPLRFGDILLRAKNNQGRDTLSANARKFALIGDPAQRIGLPYNRVKLSSINDTPAAIFEDTLSALEPVKIKGEIVDNQGNLLKGFNGDATITIYDKKASRETLANDDDSYKFNFEEFRNVIFKGGTNVKGGLFELEFVVPKDINYEIGLGKISLYAQNGITDAGGYFDGPIIGGNNENSVVDNQAPEIALFINDTAFVSGGITNNHPILIIHLNDDFGINVAGTSIGHDLVAQVKGPENGSFILNDYYISNTNDPSSGKVAFPFQNLSPGEYEIKVKAWDIGNNSVVDTIHFTVTDQAKANEIVDVYNYPNPFNDQTSFSFSHDLNGANVDIELVIYSSTGKLIKNIKVNKISTGSRENDIIWMGKENFGNELSTGVYFYKIKIKDTSLGLERESKFAKFVKL